MIAGIVLKLIGWGVPAKLARPLVFAGGAALLAGIAWASWSIWLSGHDSAVVRDHDAAVNVKAAKVAREADAVVTDTRAKDQGRAAAEERELERKLDHETNKPVTDQRRAYLRCVRLQQSARAAGKPAPACD